MLLASGFFIFGKLIETTKTCIAVKSLSGETIEIFRSGSPVRIVKRSL